MTDRELLEAAAKANWAQELADDEVSLRYSEPDDGILYLHADNQDHNGHDREFVWNPLSDDADAFRLAVKLNLHVGIDCESSGTVTIEWDFDQGGFSRELITEDAPVGGDELAATRRAIVRAAVAIGEGMSMPVVAKEGQ